ncbi:hypothetical protein JL722_7826 [Aureococcus anophagefferens]|nr:hypothetical protein JL722_7826 [Aureococcus anophagefferens]
MGPLYVDSTLLYANLARRPERDAAFRRRAAAAGFAEDQCVRFDAVDGAALDLGSVPRAYITEEALAMAAAPPTLVNGIAMTRGAAGLALTFRRELARVAAAEGDGLFVVAEDDAEFVDDFQRKLATVVAAVDAADATWDMLQIGYYAGDRAFADGGDPGAPFARPRRVAGTQGIAFRPRGAARMLEMLFPLACQLDTALAKAYASAACYVSRTPLMSAPHSTAENSDIQILPPGFSKDEVLKAQRRAEAMRLALERVPVDDFRRRVRATARGAFDADGGGALLAFVPPAAVAAERATYVEAFVADAVRQLSRGSNAVAAGGGRGESDDASDADDDASDGETPSLDVLPPFAPRFSTDAEKRNWLVYSSAGDGAAVPLWLANGPRRFDVAVTYHGRRRGDPPWRPRVDAFHRRRGGKFENLKACGAHRGYDAVLVLDDDVVVDAPRINELFAIREAFELAVVQPAFEPSGKVSHAVTAAQRGSFLRLTNFVEMTCPLFAGGALDAFLSRFDPQLKGYGADCAPPATVAGATPYALLDDDETAAEEAVPPPPPPPPPLGPARVRDGVAGPMDCARLIRAGVAAMRAVDRRGGEAALDLDDGVVAFLARRTGLRVASAALSRVVAAPRRGDVYELEPTRAYWAEVRGAGAVLFLNAADGGGVVCADGVVAAAPGRLAVLDGGWRADRVAKGRAGPWS